MRRGRFLKLALLCLAMVLELSDWQWFQTSYDPDLVLDVTYKALVKYLGEEDAKLYTEPIMAETSAR